MQLDANWEDAGTKNTDIGPVHMRHLMLDDIDCLEGTVTTREPIDKLMAIIVDVGDNLAWTSADLVWSHVLHQDANVVHYVQLLNNPIPISDRYWYLESIVVPDGAGVVFQWDRLDGAQRYPEKHKELLGDHSGAIEVAYNLGSWSFYPMADGENLARFRTCTDAGGRIPRWAVEAAARAMLPNNLVDLITHSKKN
jgi:hypothetical protein